jgi:hypothetical protein
MIRSAKHVPAEPEQIARTPGERRRGFALGTLAGTIGLGCCVYPAALALTGLSSATAAVALGNRLYADWGWAFKGAAVVFASGALYVQKRRSDRCPMEARPDVRRIALWLGGTGIATYALLYAGTKGLERLA